MVSLGTPVYITVRAVTTNVGRDISRGLSGSRRGVQRGGEDLGRAFSQGFNRGVDTNVFRRVANGLQSMVPGAEAARKGFATLVRSSYTLGTALTVVVGGASAVVSSLGALAGAAGGAIATVSVLGNAMFALGAGMIASRLALGGIGGALQKLNQQTTRSAAVGGQTALQVVRSAQAREAATRRIEDAERSLARVIEDSRERLVDANTAVADAQIDLNRAIREGREELQQLGFEAEDAAINEQRAAIELERARETLARLQDLPPNDRARREAELAYAEAELNYRKASDANADLAKEQDRLARTGVNGLSSVIAARDRVAQAEADKAEVVEDSLEREADALRDVAEARQAANNVDDAQDAAGGGNPVAAAGAAGAAWDEGLNDAQRRFVLFLNSLRPKMEELSRIAAEAFLPKLQTAIQTLVDRGYPTLAAGIGLVASALGDAAITLANVLTSDANLEKFAFLFQESADLIKIFGSIFAQTFDAILSILVATAPMAERFFGFIDTQMTNFANHLNSVTGNNELVTFFERAEATAVKFGDIFGNLFAGIGAVIDANMGEGTGGWILLDYFEKATSGFGNSEGLKTFFADIATNATHVFDSLGLLLGVLGDLGANQSIGEAFGILNDPAAVANFSNILQTAADAGPALATLTTTIIGIISALADTGAMTVFFDTLNAIFTVVYDFVSDPANKAFLDFFGRIFAFFSAIGFVAGLLGTGLKIVVGIFGAFLGPIATLVGGVGRFLIPLLTTLGRVVLPLVAGAFRILNAVFLANPIGLVVTAIGLVVGALIWFFNETEIGRKIWAEFTRFLGEAWANLQQFVTEAMLNIMDFIAAGFQWIDKYVVKPFQVVLRILGETFDNVGRFIGDVWRNIQNAIDTVWKWINQNIFAPIRDAVQFVSLAFQVAGQVIALAWDNMLKALDLAWKWIDQNVFNPIRTAVDLVQQAFENVAEGIATAWDGIKKAAAGPVNFVIDTVYNNNLRNFWNDIAGALGMNNLKLPKVPTVAFASGGVLPGYTPGRDVHQFFSPTAGRLLLSGGEAIMRPEWVRAVGGPAAVERMNRAARSGVGGSGGPSGGRTQRFAKGGIIDFAGDVIDNIGKMGKIVADFFSDPVGAVKKNLIDGIIKPLSGGRPDNMFEKLIGGVPVKIATTIGEAVQNFFGGGGQQDGPVRPGNAMGWSAMWNVVKSQFPDARLNSSVRPGAKTVNGGQSYHALGRAIDLPARMDIFNFLANAFPNSRELIFSPAGIRQLQNGQRHLWGGAVKAQHYDHVHWAMAKGGTVFPSKDGSIVRVAEAGRPERVEPLDPNGLSDRDKAWAELFTEGLRGDVKIYVTQLPNEDGEAFARRVSEIISKDMRAGGV